MRAYAASHNWGSESCSDDKGLPGAVGRGSMVDSPASISVLEGTDAIKRNVSSSTPSAPKTIFTVSREISVSTVFDSTFGLGIHSDPCRSRV